jgi:hypothetical protein
MENSGKKAENVIKQIRLKSLKGIAALRPGFRGMVDAVQQ